MIQSMKYALAALDMDGTLLNTDHAITDWTREAIDRAARAGGVIALCTGRCLSELREHLAALPGVRYAICENGGCLYDVGEDRIISQAVIDRSEAERILKLVSHYDACVQCFMQSQSYMQIAGVEAFRHYHIHDFAAVFEQGSVFVGNMAAVRKGRELEKINLYFTSERDKADFRQKLGDVELHLADSLGTGFEISPKEATKGLGLQALCRHLGIPVERTMAVGDGGNDLELMSAAGFSVAMGNATGEVRRAAHAVTEDNDHDGAARAVVRYMLGEKA